MEGAKKVLIIAEKPDMGRNIAAAIEPRALKRQGYLEGDTYIITWAIGHLVALADPDAYDPSLKKWNIAQLPILPDKFQLVANPKTRDQLKVIAEVAKRCDRIVNACDAGREGQYIFYLIQTFLGLKQPTERLWISDLTPETIRKGFAELQAGDVYEPLTRAACARSEADWIIGMNGTRAMTTKHNVLLSVGRVQTPVLALLYDRHKQIEQFSSATFYEVYGYFAGAEGVADGAVTPYRGMWQGDKITDVAQAEALVAKCSGQPARVVEYEKKEAREYAFKLFDLTLLQREANAKLGFSAKKTLDVAQALYEKHKVISYPRTNSNYVTEANLPDMYRALEMLKPHPTYGAWAQSANKGLVHKGNSAVCNPAKVEDHHAILPTVKRAGALSPDEAAVYDLIIRRFLAQFHPPALYMQHTVMTEVIGELFKTTIKQLLDAGWKVIYAQDEKKAKAKKAANADGAGDEVDEVESEFVLDAAAPLVCARVESKERQTQPPKPFTEGTLLRAMESAGKQIEDEALRDAMKDSGLGTPATRAATIERLKQVDYIAMKGKTLAITDKGIKTIELIRAAGIDLLTSPEMTGQWERRLTEIAKGQADAGQFINKVKQFAQVLVDKVRDQRAVQFASKATAATLPAKAGGTRASGGATRTRTAAAAKPKAAPGTPICACPREGCGGQLFLGKKGYGCSNYRSGCKFVVWKKQHAIDKTITETMLVALVEKGMTNAVKFKQKDGSSRSGKIRLLSRDTGDLVVDYE
jgi:DNA topoisomerase-3